jgi:hypothetical protein
VDSKADWSQYLDLELLTLELGLQKAAVGLFQRSFDSYFVSTCRPASTSAGQSTLEFDRSMWSEHFQHSKATFMPAYRLSSVAVKGMPNSSHSVRPCPLPRRLNGSLLVFLPPLGNIVR